jgi:thioredoxin 1
MELNPILDLVDASGFEAEVLRAAGPVLVDFWAEWCPPCRMIEPVVTELASAHSGQLMVGRLNIDSCPEIGIRYAVLGLPTLILFIGGQPVDRLVGFSSPGHVRRWVADTMQAATHPS